MLATNLKRMREVWTQNPNITRTELIVEFRASSQNITRWMHSAGFGEMKSIDKEFRYLPLPDLVIQEITNLPPDGLSERQNTEYYIKAGYNSHSIALHQNILWSTVDDRRYKLENIQQKQLQDQLVKDQLVREQQLTVQSCSKEYPETPQEQENRVYEYGQQEDNYPEFGDEQPYHISEITQAQFFSNGTPICQRCKRDVTYTDIIHYNNTRPAYPDSFINVNARPKIIFPMQVACDHMNQWAEYVDFPLTGYKDIDDLRILEAFIADIIANFFRNRMAYIAKELIQNRKKPGYHWGGRSYK